MKKTWIIITLLMLISACKVDGTGKTRMLIEKENMTTHCIGRHVIDMPSSFLPSPITTGIFKAMGRDAQDPSFEVIVRATGLTRSQFAAAVRKRRTELTTSDSDTVNVPRLEKALSEEATLFRVQRIDDAYISEIYFLRGPSIVIVSLDSYRGQFLAAEESLIKFAAGIKEKGENISGTQPRGFCIGPLILTGEFIEERANFIFRSDLHKGVDFDISIDTFRKDDATSLLARVSGPDSLLTKFNVRHAVLRTRELTVAGMRAQEWLGWAKLGEEQDGKALKFVLETMRPTPDKASPGIHLTFETGQPLEDGSTAKTLIPDEDAMRLWDAVVTSIRPMTR
jgi:hypothetical protein